MQGSDVQPDTSTDTIFPETEPENVFKCNVNHSCHLGHGLSKVYKMTNQTNTIG